MPTPLKRPKQATETRQAGLVEAALNLAAQRSPADITTADLAQAVGITQGAVFRHFTSKECIWLAALDWTADTLMARLQAAVALANAAGPSPPTPLTALHAVFLAHVDFVMEYPGVPRIIFQELQHARDSALKARVRALMQRYRELVTGLLGQARTQNLLNPEVDLNAAAVLFMGSVQGLVMQAMLSGQIPTMGVLAPEVFAIYLRGIAHKERT